MSQTKIDAFLALKSDGRLLAGRERIRLLEAVAEHGSITKAAKATGFSYKTAWEAVDAINNLLPTPAFVTRAGGRAGGSAVITDEGRRLIATFHRLEGRLAKISSLIAEDGLDGLGETLLWTVGVRISARNMFQTEIVDVRRWPVDVEVTLKVSETISLLAIVTNSAVEELDLRPGRRVLALVKASFVHVVPPDGVPADALNRFDGLVVSRTDAEVNSEIQLDIGGGKTITAVVPRRRAEAAGLGEGDRAVATFDPDHVILAVD
ncbi:TOBE domain-containing protein [Azorhizobium doebereinerae]|uniref:TOBE domain-containing protein n=1 Tax=Azorhizobium doebereinerae TaxID=281091 RepID=UPI0003F4DE86|nr:TOBE domain-containing protein [Azorhizobium doebereinerae]